MMRRIASGLALAALLALAGCGSAPQQPAHTPASVPRPAPAAKPPAKPEPGVPVLPPAGSGRGGYYKDDGPGENPPPNLLETPDAEVRNEPLNPRTSRPYVVFGKTYTPITDPDKPFVQRGLGTWYGKKFHGQRTSSGELYDMYKMSAAHPTLPIPSYAKVTNLDNGKQVVVRINDRGPFHSTRVIDVSYTAALKLGLLDKGSHPLEVERILPADVDRFNAERKQQKPVSTMAAVAPAPKGEPRAESNAVNKPKPRAPSEMAALLYPAPSTGAAAVSATAAAAVSATAAAAVQEVAAAAKPSASAGPQPLQSMPRAAPMILTPQAGAAMPAAVSQVGMTAAAAAGGYYLQLGAYGRKENAEAVRAKLAMDGGLSGLEIVPSGDVHRLYAGPFASRQEAAQAIAALPATLGLKPLVIQR